MLGWSLWEGFIQLRQDRNSTTVSRDRHARSYERVHPAPARSQFYYSFVRSTRTILRKGSSSSGKIAILLQLRAINTHDLTKRFIQLRQDRNFTTVSCDQHARSYERVAFPQAFSGPWRPPTPNYLSKVLSKVLSKALSKVSKLSKLVKQASKAGQ